MALARLSHALLGSPSLNFHRVLRAVPDDLSFGKMTYVCCENEDQRQENANAVKREFRGISEADG